MATTSKTTYTHTCDLCGGEGARGDLRRLGRVDISEGDIIIRNPELKGKPCDVCPACQARPISELVAYVEAAEAAERDSRMAPNPLRARRAG